MLPLQTLPNVPRTPTLTRVMVALIVVAFGAQWAASTRGIDLASSLGVVPSRLTNGQLWAAALTTREVSPALFSPIYALFLHADALHLGFNLLFLWVFGAALEGEIGRVRWTLIYFGGGFAATLAHVATHAQSNVPAIGASGAIAALLGAYFVRSPRAWVLTYFPPIWILPVPAPLFLLVWVGAQVVGAFDFGAQWDLGAISASAQSEVAWLAHLGGWAFGAFYAWAIRSNHGRGVKARVASAKGRARKRDESAAIVRK